QDIDSFLNQKQGPVQTTNSDSQSIAETIKPTQTMSIDENSDWVEKMSPLRKAIAKAMVTSRTVIPHVTVFDKVRVEKLVAHRSTYKAVANEEEIRLTYLPYVVKAMVAM